MTRNSFALVFAAVLFAGCSLFSSKKPGKEEAVTAPATTAAAQEDWSDSPTTEETGTDEAAALITLADTKMEEDDLQAAKDPYLKAYDLLPDTDERRVYVSKRLGDIMRKGNKIRAAKRLFQQAITLSKKNNNGGQYLADAYNGLAYCLEKEGRIDTAINNLKRAAQLTPDKAAKAKINSHIRELQAKKKTPPAQ